MGYTKGEEIKNKMETVFGITEENAKEMTGKCFVIDVVQILDAEAKKVQIHVYDDKRFDPSAVITTFAPTVVMNHIVKNQEDLVGGEPIVCEYKGMEKFKDGKKHYGRDKFHLWAFYKAVKDKSK